jgi:hypothetical protein
MASSDGQKSSQDTSTGLQFRFRGARICQKRFISIVRGGEENINDIRYG